MRRAWIFVLLCALCTLFVSATARAGSVRCTPSYPGDERCDWYHRTPGAKPAISDMVCIFYIQPYPDNVVLTIFLKSGSTRRYAPKFSQMKDWQCIGRHWIAKAVRINLCNGFEGDADFVGADLHFLTTKPQYSEDETACLYGSDRCGQMGFKVKPPS